MLSIKNLCVEFTVNNTSKKPQLLKAVNDISLDIQQGETLAIVGESGSGKSQLFNAVMGLLPKNASVMGEIDFLDQPLLNLNTKQLNKIRGKEIGMIFQDPMTALNPYLRIGKQLTEVLAAHQDTVNHLDKKAIKALAIKILERVQIKDAAQRFESYPHELSGGMRQRVVIAMALLCKPKLIIADEPTTALDVTIQTEIIRLLKDIHTRENTSIVLITHDLPLVAGLCDRIAVMYAGRIVEMGTLDEIFKYAKHPYTQALLNATPQHSSQIKLQTQLQDSLQEKKQSSRMQAIDGSPPDPLNLPQGCAFNPRCTQMMDICLEGQPPLKIDEDGHQYRCFLEVSDND